MTVMPDPQRVADLLRQVAAEEIMPRFQRLAAHEIREKTGPHDLVTIADEASERFLEQHLRALLPGSVVVGEEATAANPGLLDRLADAAPAWIIDPVDGTRSFARGKPGFTVIVALAVAGRTRAGWIYDPVADELAMGQAGQGSTVNGAPATLSAGGEASDLRGSLGLGYFPPAERKALERRAADLPGLRPLRMAGREYLDLLTGRMDFILYRRLMPWDHAAGVLLHAEAGGEGRLVDGDDYRPTLREGPILLAPDAPSWHAVRAVLFD